MKTIEKSILVWYSANQMFDLVTAVDRYPEFLPWCDQARIVTQHDDGVTAEIGMAYGKIKQSFTTRNVHQEGRQIDLTLVKGPFSSLQGQWRFISVGDTTDDACRTELSLSYGFDNSLLGSLVSPVFDKIASTLVEAFFNRANDVYG